MPVSDQEIETLKDGVTCGVVLEREGWALDRRESTRRALKYRRGTAEIIIVIHKGRGWFDPLSDAKGDIFTLVEHLSGRSFGEACAVLRPLVGLAADPQPWARPARRSNPAPLIARWTRRPTPEPGSATWRYLARERGLPRIVLDRALVDDCLREGPRGSMWAAHRDDAGALTGWEERGPSWRGFSTDGTKILFRLGASRPERLCITEAAIDAMSLAALEGLPDHTLYVSTGGGWGPASVAALRHLATLPRLELVAATDRNRQGDRYAERIAELASEAGRTFCRLRPEAEDWNEGLRPRPGASA